MKDEDEIDDETDYFLYGIVFCISFPILTIVGVYFLEGLSKGM